MDVERGRKLGRGVVRRGLGLVRDGSRAATHAAESLAATLARGADYRESIWSRRRARLRSLLYRVADPVDDVVDQVERLLRGRRGDR